MKSLKSITCSALAVVIALSVCSCSSSRVLNYSYDKVADAAKEKFYINTWTSDGTKRALMNETNNTLSLEYYEWEFPDIKIYSQIYVKNYGSGKSKVWVYVKDCNSWWYPFSFSPSMATEVLDAFEKRLKWYKFAWGKMPWDKFNINRNEKLK